MSDDDALLDVDLSEVPPAFRPLVRERLAELDRLSDVLGADHPSTLLALVRVAAALRLAGLLPDALALNRRAADRLTDELGELAWTVRALAESDAGVTLAALGRFDEATSGQHDALGRLRRLTEPLDRRTQIATWNLGYTLSAQGLHGDALHLQRGLVEQIERTGNVTPLEAFFARSHEATALGAAGDLEASARTWRLVVRGFKELLGDQNRRTLGAQARFADSLRAMGQLEHAREMQLELVEWIAEAAGSRDPIVIDVKEDLSVTAVGLGDLNLGLLLGEEVVALRGELYGGVHPRTLRAMRLLAGTLALDGQRARADLLARTTVDRLESTLGVDHPDTRDARDRLARVLAGTAASQRLRELFPRRLMRRSRELEPDWSSLAGGETLAASMTASEELAESELGSPPALPGPGWGREVLTRTPHLELDRDGALAPGETVIARVFADCLAAELGEQASRIDVELPPATSRLWLDVWLVASVHFDHAGDEIQRLALERDESETDVLVFELLVRRDAAELDDEPFVMAVFSHGGRPVGRVRRPVEIARAVEA